MSTLAGKGHTGRGRSKETALTDNVRIVGRGLWTLNSHRGHKVRGETIRRMKGGEWRNWSPRHSKLAAAILRTKLDKTSLLPAEGSTIIYLGAGHGTTVSHLHDAICGAGNRLASSIIAVDISARCLRDLVKLAESRPGILPLMADARKPETISPWLAGRVDWLFQDVSQAGQVDFFIKAAQNFLSNGGTALLSLKSASERHAEGGAEEHYAAAAEALTVAGLMVEETIRLVGWEEQHAVLVVRAPTDWQ